MKITFTSLLLLFSLAAFAQPHLTITSADLNPAKPPIFLKRELILYQQTEAYLVHPSQMQYLLALHRYVQDSMPDLEAIADAYKRVLEEKDADYQLLLKNSLETEKMAKNRLLELNKMGENLKTSLENSEVKLNDALQTTLQLQKTYLKTEKKNRFKRALNAVGLISAGFTVGYFIQKLN